MWRFAVYTHKTSILNKTCITTLRQALKHTDSRTDCVRFLSNDASSSIRIEKDAPIRDVFSIDDFGLLSVNRSQSIDSHSSAGSERTFLEQLFRNDTLNTFSNVQIPTTISSKELGGTHEVFGFDYVSELLSEGALPEEVAENLATESSLAELQFAPTGETSTSGSYLDDQEPSTSGLEVTDLPFLIPNLDGNNEKKKTRQVLSENIRRERKLNLSTTTIPEQSENSNIFHAPASIPSLGEMLFPDTLATETFTSQWKEGEYSAVPVENSKVAVAETQSEFSLEVLEGIVAEGTVTELREELKAVRWPEWIFAENWKTMKRAGNILRFAVENSTDYGEAEEILKQFASSSVLAVIPDDVLLHLATKSITASTDISSIIKQLEHTVSLSPSRELHPIRQLVESRLVEFYSAAIRSCSKSSSSLLTYCQTNCLDNSPDAFLKCYAEYHANVDNFSKSFDEWKRLSKKYGSLQGIDSYWVSALNINDDGLAKRIESLLLHSGKSEHPFATMARMICTLVKLDQLDYALEVFRTVSVSGRYFREFLASFAEQKDLKSIERLATLVERGMIAEKRRGSSKRGVNKSDTPSEVPSSLGEEVHAVLTKFYGVGGQKQKKKFVDKNQKKKIHRVDEEQLHQLCKAIQKAWMKCVDNKESLNRLIMWCQTNRIEIDEKIQKRIDSSFST